MIHSLIGCQESRLDKNTLNSVWSGSIEGAFFDTEKFDKYRDIQLPEWETSKKASKDAYYVLGVDVGRLGLIVGSSKMFSNCWDVFLQR